MCVKGNIQVSIFLPKDRKSYLEFSFDFNNALCVK